jgi:hypothetical protein
VTNYTRRVVDIRWVVDIQGVVVDNSPFLPVVDRRNILLAVGRHNILQAVGRLPSLGCRIDHTARLDPHRPRSGDMGQVGFEVAVMLGLSSRKDQRRSGLVEGR